MQLKRQESSRENFKENGFFVFVHFFQEVYHEVGHFVLIALASCSLFIN